MAKIWFLMSEETRQKLKALMPVDWTPPKENKPVKYPTVEEIDKTMRRKPRFMRRVS